MLEEDTHSLKEPSSTRAKLYCKLLQSCHCTVKHSTLSCDARKYTNDGVAGPSMELDGRRQAWRGLPKALLRKTLWWRGEATAYCGD